MGSMSFFLSWETELIYAFVKMISRVRNTGEHDKRKNKIFGEWNQSNLCWNESHYFSYNWKPDRRIWYMVTLDLLVELR